MSTNVVMPALIEPPYMRDPTQVHPDYTCTISQETSVCSSLITDERHRHTSTGESVLDILRFSAGEMERYITLPPYALPGNLKERVYIPCSYARSKASALFAQTWSDHSLATHTLIIHELGQVNGTLEAHLKTLLYPIHDMVLLTQCGNWEDTLQYRDEIDVDDTLPTLRIAVPHTDTIDPLLRFLHFHNAEDLYDTLLRLYDTPEQGDTLLVHFARNVRALGVLDGRIPAIVRAVLNTR